MRDTKSRLLLVAGLIAVAACSGGGGDVTEPPIEPPPGPPPSTAPVATITITPDHPTVLTEDHLTLAAVLHDSSGTVLTGRTVTWSSDKPEIATISASGEVTPGTLGDAVITAQSEGKSATVPLAVRIRFTQVSVGYDHTCGLTQPGTPWCWGANGSRQLGTASADPVSTPAKVQGNRRFTTISAGSTHSCGLDSSGAAWCWGENEHGELGNDAAGADRPEPVAVAGAHTFIAIAAGETHTCGLEADGTAWCWGDNTDGQLDGVGGESASVPVPLPPPAGLDFRLSFSLLDAGFNYTCAAADEGSGGHIWCWGRGSEGELGFPVRHVGFTVVGSLSRGVLLSTGGFHACAVGTYEPTPDDFQDRGMCWGDNSDGQVSGTGETSMYTLVYPHLEGDLALAGGHRFTCVLTAGGQIRCWGYNGHGELGRGTVSPKEGDGPIPGTDTYTTVAAGGFHACALSSAGVLSCWGENDDGEVGDGTTNVQMAPVAVAGQL